MRGFIATAAWAALSSTVIAGNANIYNHCDSDIYVWPVDAANWVDGTTMRNPSDPTIIPANGSYTETMHALTAGGVSLKLATIDTLWDGSVKTPITQLEYTLADTLWYDTSNVDCTGTACPFQPLGLYMNSGDGCPTLSCTAGAPTCTGAYTLWNDDWATLNCAGDADLDLYLCTETPLRKRAVENAKSSPKEKKDATPVKEEKRGFKTIVTKEATPAAHRGHALVHNHAHKHRL
jgi:hypothetical protein